MEELNHEDVEQAFDAEAAVVKDIDDILNYRLTGVALEVSSRLAAARAEAVRSLTQRCEQCTLVTNKVDYRAVTTNAQAKQIGDLEPNMLNAESKMRRYEAFGGISESRLTMTRQPRSTSVFVSEICESLGLGKKDKARGCLRDLTRCCLGPCARDSQKLAARA